MQPIWACQLVHMQFNYKSRLLKSYPQLLKTFWVQKMCDHKKSQAVTTHADILSEDERRTVE